MSTREKKSLTYSLNKKKIDENYHRQIELKEHSGIVGEPGALYFGAYISYVASISCTGVPVAHSVLYFFEYSQLCSKLTINGSDVTSSMTGAKKKPFAVWKSCCKGQYSGHICITLQ